MKLKPSKRPKKRYIVFEVISQELATDSAIRNAIRKSVVNVLGTKYEDAGLRFLKEKHKANKRILRVNHRFCRDVISAINKNRSIKTLGMSGILKKAEEKYFKIAS
jgi:RNase P/RNase MRP subunit POP5